MSAASTQKNKRATICRVGITGGFGSGKSTVARFISNLHHPVILSDEIAKSLIDSDTQIQKKIISEFGEEVYNNKKKLRKNILADIVFNDADKLQTLNRIVHPKTIKYIDKQVSKLSTQGSTLIFVESALIYEAKIEDSFDYIIAVISKEKNIFERLSQNGKMIHDQIERRLLHQIPMEEKAVRADFVIRNDSSLEELQKNTKFIVHIIETLMLTNIT